MKTKWWLIGLATLAICGGVAVAIPALQPSGSGVTKANFDRVNKGMTEKDVETIFGEPGIPTGWGGFPMQTWNSPDGACVFVMFADGNVTNKHWTESTETIPRQAPPLAIPAAKIAPARPDFRLQLSRQASQ